jgi:endonuclease YncB( thermonuclease family)
MERMLARMIISLVGSAVRLTIKLVLFAVGLLLRLIGIRSFGPSRTGASLPHPFDISGANAYVIDGDTIASGRARIRIWGIDAPEMGQRYHGRAARAHLIKLMGSAPLRIVPRDVDHYGRLVAQVFLINEDEELFDLGQAMVDDGFARSASAYSRAYVRSERRARRAAAGLWSDNGGMLDPTAYRRAMRA